MKNKLLLSGIVVTIMLSACGPQKKVAVDSVTNVADENVISSINDLFC